MIKELNEDSPLNGIWVSYCEPSGKEGCLDVAFQDLSFEQAVALFSEAGLNALVGSTLVARGENIG